MREFPPFHRNISFIGDGDGVHSARDHLSALLSSRHDVTKHDTGTSITQEAKSDKEPEKRRRGETRGGGGYQDSKTMPSSKGQPTDPELREQVKEEVKAEEKGEEQPFPLNRNH